MIRSMTGFGRAQAELPSHRVTVEVRALNSKQLDLNTRIASRYREKEGEIRGLVSQAVERGKVDLFLSVEGTAVQPHGFNKELALAYAAQLKELAAALGQEEPDYLSVLVRMPGVISQESQALGAEEWEVVKTAVVSALTELDSFRRQEGGSLHKELSFRLGRITELAEAVGPLEKVRNEQKREKLLRLMQEASENVTADPNRFEQELIYYLERLDFTEERVRLKQHCDYFTETLNSQEAGGRKLGFIGQEMGREINTLGSKANDAAIQKLVVEMKDELEKIKEQLANIL